MTQKISALTAASAAALANEYEINEAGTSKKVTGTQIRTMIAGANGASGVWGGFLTAANMNVTTDQAIPIVLPPGFTKYRIITMYAWGASISLTTAVGGIYPTTSKGGTPVVAASQAWSVLTAAAVDATGSLLVLTNAAIVSTAIYDLANIYLSLSTPQGAAATANIGIVIVPFP